MDHDGKKNYINIINNVEVIKDSISVKHNTGMSQRLSLSLVTQAEEKDYECNEEKKRKRIDEMHLWSNNEMDQVNVDKPSQEVKSQSKVEKPDVFRFTTIPVATPRKKKVHSRWAWNKKNCSINAIEYFNFIAVTCVSPRKRVIHSAIKVRRKKATLLSSSFFK